MLLNRNKDNGSIIYIHTQWFDDKKKVLYWNTIQ